MASRPEGKTGLFPDKLVGRKSEEVVDRGLGCERDENTRPPLMWKAVMQQAGTRKSN